MPHCALDMWLEDLRLLKNRKRSSYVLCSLLSWILCGEADETFTKTSIINFLTYPSLNVDGQRQSELCFFLPHYIFIETIFRSNFYCFASLLSIQGIQSSSQRALSFLTTYNIFWAGIGNLGPSNFPRIFQVNTAWVSIACLNKNSHNLQEPCAPDIELPRILWIEKLKAR